MPTGTVQLEFDYYVEEDDRYISMNSYFLNWSVTIEGETRIKVEISDYRELSESFPLTEQQKIILEKMLEKGVKAAKGVRI